MSDLTVQFNLKQDLNGTPGAIISHGNFHQGDSFFVEILMGDIRPDAVGLTGTFANITFNPNQLQNIDIPFNPTDINSPLLPAQFPLFRMGTLDNINGTINNLGGAALPSFGIGSPLGINQLESLSLMHFKAINSGDSSLTLNIDLDQTGFADGTLVNLTTPNQFTQPISITSQTVPEPSIILGVIAALIFGLLFNNCRQISTIFK